MTVAAERGEVTGDGDTQFVGTIAPEDVVDREPERFFLTMAATELSGCCQSTRSNLVEHSLQEAGFVVTEHCRSLRNKKLPTLPARRRGVATARQSAAPLFVRLDIRTRRGASLHLDARRGDVEAGWLDRPASDKHHHRVKGGSDAPLKLNSRCVRWRFVGTRKSKTNWPHGA